MMCCCIVVKSEILLIRITTGELNIATRSNSINLKFLFLLTWHFLYKLLDSLILSSRHLSHFQFIVHQWLPFQYILQIKVNSIKSHRHVPNPCLRIDPNSSSIDRLNKSHPYLLISIVVSLEYLAFLHILPNISCYSDRNLKRWHPLISISPSLNNNFSPVSRLLATHLHPHSNFVLGRTPPLISTCVEVERYVAYLAWTVCALDSAPRGNSVDRPCLLLFRRHVAEQLLVFFIPGTKPFSPHYSILFNHKKKI